MSKVKQTSEYKFASQAPKVSLADVLKNGSSKDIKAALSDNLSPEDIMKLHLTFTPNSLNKNDSATTNKHG